MMTVKEIRNKLEQLKGQEQQLQTDLNDIEYKLKSNEKNLDYHEKAQIIIREVGLKTQQKLQYNISEITSLAMEAIMQEPYELRINFVERRGTTECDITFYRQEIEIDPEYSGGGARDIASFALRISSWSMKHPRTDNCIIIDEPFKHLKGEKPNELMLQMVRQICKKIGLQIIMVGDERVPRETSLQNVDKLFEVSKTGKISKIK